MKRLEEVVSAVAQGVIPHAVQQVWYRRSREGESWIVWASDPELLGTSDDELVALNSLRWWRQ